MSYKVTIHKEAIADSLAFSREIIAKDNISALLQREGSVVRNDERRIIHCAFGKIAEEAFAEMMYNKFGINFDIDYTIYQGKFNGDGGNDFKSYRQKDGFVVQSNYKIDVKHHLYRPNWLVLLEKQANHVDSVVMVEIETKKSETYTVDWLENKSHFDCAVSGYATKDMLIGSNGKPSYPFNRGDYLYDHRDPSKKLNMQLKSGPNAGYPKDLLSQDWDAMFANVIQNSIYEGEKS